MKSRNLILLVLVLGCLQIASPVVASANVAVTVIPSSLSDEERSSLRYRLENLYNEVDLLIRNRKSDAIDIQKQEQAAQFLKVYERIPFQARLSEIHFQLSASASDHGLKVQSFHFLPKVAAPMASASPAADNHDNLATPHLTADQIAEKIRFRFIVEGDKNQVRTWIQSWPENVMRLMEPEGGVRSPILQFVGGGQWEVEAWAFRFHDIQYPKLSIHDPKQLLPEWARRNPELFAQEEPLLWNLVEKAQETGPRAAAYLPDRERFLLNDARMNFFFLKAGQSR